MSIKKVEEAWGDYKRVVKSDYKNNHIKRFKSDIEQVIVPTLKDINIDVNIGSANTLSDGEVVYEAFAGDDLITISFQSNNYDADAGNVVAEMFTMSGSEMVGNLNINDLEQIKIDFLNTAEELGLELTDDNKPDEKEEKLKKSMGIPTSKEVVKSKEVKDKEVKKEIPLPEPEPEENEPEEKVELRQLLDVYKDAIEVYRRTGKLNNEMSIAVENTKNPGQFTIITCYYVDRNRCLAQCSTLKLDQLVTYETLGKYLVDLSAMYQTSVITVYDANGDEVFSEEVAEYIGGEK